MDAIERIGIRTAEQKERDRAKISALMLKGYGRDEIADILAEEGEYRLSPIQVGSDIAMVRKAWLDTQEINYAAMLAQERDRIDALEDELWNQLRASSKPKIRRTIESWTKNNPDNLSDEEIEQLATKISQTTELSGIDVSIFGHIIRVQQERRKIFGLYTPETKKTTHEVIIKGYKIVSPSDWDEPIEGKFELKSTNA